MSEEVTKPRKGIAGFFPKWPIALVLAAAAVGGAIVIFGHLSNRTPTEGVELSEYAISSENADQITLLACLGKGDLSDIAYSPDGDLLAVASSIGVFIYEACSFKEVYFFESEERVEGIAFSPDGVCLALATRKGVQLLQVSDGSTVCTISGLVHAVASRFVMSEAVFSPDGGHMALTDDYQVSIWELPSGKLVGELITPRFPSIAFSPDSAYLAAAGTDDSIDLWQIPEGELGQTLPLPAGWRVNDIAFSPDGLYLATTSFDDDSGEPGSVVRIWRVSDGELIRTQELDVRVGSIAFSPDSNYYALGMKEGVRLFYVSDGRLAFTLSGFPASRLSYSPDGSHLACCSGLNVRIWRVQDGLNVRTLEGFTAPVESVTFFPENGCLVSTGTEINLWRLSDSALVKRLEIGENKSITFSPKGDFLACACYDDIVQLRRFPEGTMISTLETPTDWTIAISPDGTHFSTTSCEDKTVRLWRTSDGSLEHTFEGHGDSLGRVAFSPDGAYLAWGSRIWNISKGTLVQTLKEHEGGDLVYSPDGIYLASPIRIWKASNGELLHKLDVVASCEGVDISPDGAFLASTDAHTVYLWRAADGMLMHTLEGPCGFTWTKACTAFSPDGTLLAAAISDYHCTVHTVLLWRVADGALLRTFERHTRLINSVAFSPDGAYLFSCSDDGTVHIWGVES